MRDRSCLIRRLGAGEVPCLTCAWIGGPHSARHDRPHSARNDSLWIAQQDGAVAAGTILRLEAFSEQTFGPDFGGFDSGHYLFRVVGGPDDGAHFYVAVMASWSGQGDQARPPARETLYPDGWLPLLPDPDALSQRLGRALR
jgi:hypothetical protein